MVANVYFDESGTHAGSRLMSMAGYWFDESQAARFGRDWVKVLAGFDLSHAHMTDCASGYGEYRDRTKAERVKIQSLLIEHIKRRSRFGFGICMSPDAYESAIGEIPGAPSAYTYCLMMCMNKVADFASAIGFDGRIGYFFEAGHQKAREAQSFMKCIPAASGNLSDQYRYATHSFLDKRICLPLQAADMFAWHLRHYYDRCLDGHCEPRKDYVALSRKFDVHTVVEARHLLALKQTFLRLGPLIEDSREVEAATEGQRILQQFGLTQMPVLLPKNTRIGKGDRSKKPIVRY